LLPVRLDEAEKQKILAHLPELPLGRQARFVEEYDIPPYNAEVLTSARSLSDYFEDTIRAYGGETKRVSNWIMNDVLALLNERALSAKELQLRPEHLAEIIRLVDENAINASTGRDLLIKVEDSGIPPRQIVEVEGLSQVSDSAAIRAICAEIIKENPSQTGQYQAGKTELLGWFIGRVMGKTKGKADPQTAKTALQELLGK